MLSAVLGILLQSGLAAPQVGFLRAADGRLYPVFGMQGAFVLGVALEPDIIAAARYGALLAEKTPTQLRVTEDGKRSSAAAIGTALFALDSVSGILYAWLPDERKLLAYSRGVFWVDEQYSPAGEIVAISARGGKLRWLVRDAGRPAGTFDAGGNLWTVSVSATEVHCGNKRWLFDHPVQSAEPLGEGWVLLRTDSARYAARCGLPDLYEIPNPEAFPREGQ